jgi:hypothetical protein
MVVLRLGVCGPPGSDSLSLSPSNTGWVTPAPASQKPPFENKWENITVMLPASAVMAKFGPAIAE